MSLFVFPAVALDPFGKSGVRLRQALHVVPHRFDQDAIVANLLFDPIETGLHPIETGLYPIETDLYSVEAGLYPIETGLYSVEAVVYPIETVIDAIESLSHVREAAAHLVSQDLQLGTHGSRHSIASESGQDVSPRRRQGRSDHSRVAVYGQIWLYAQ
jgi:hypothetical protein